MPWASRSNRKSRNSICGSGGYSSYFLHDQSKTNISDSIISERVLLITKRLDDEIAQKLCRNFRFIFPASGMAAKQKLR
jgi:hypothetical protein